MRAVAAQLMQRVESLGHTVETIGNIIHRNQTFIELTHEIAQLKLKPKAPMRTSSEKLDQTSGVCASGYNQRGSGAGTTRSTRPGTTRRIARPCACIGQRVKPCQLQTGKGSMTQYFSNILNVDARRPGLRRTIANAGVL